MEIQGKLVKNMITSEMYERVAKNVGCTINQLMEKHKRVKEANADALKSAGVSEEEIDTKTLRMCAAEMRVETARLSKSGCEMLEGVFLSTPRYKDWGKVFYEKYKTMLNGLDEMGRTMLVSQGLITLYLHDEQGGYAIHHNPSLTNKQVFAEGCEVMKGSVLPKQATDIGDGTGFFVCIENKSNPTYPSGSPNYAYGKARATQDLERTCLFYGRKVGDTSAPTLMEFKFRGDLAKVNYPTFSPLRIPANVSKNGVAYAKAGVSTYTLEESVANIFSKPPMLADGSGFIADNLKVLNGLEGVRPYVESLSDKDKWDALACTIMEVAHIDPRESGGYVITCADLDLISPHAPIDLYVSQEEEHKVSFGVGSILAVVGQPYINRDDEPKIANTGWYCVESVDIVEYDTNEEDDNWEQ